MYMKKHRRVKTRKFLQHAICNLHSCYNFALVLQETALVFSQSERVIFFTYIINNVKETFLELKRFHKKFTVLGDVKPILLP